MAASGGVPEFVLIVVGATLDASVAIEVDTARSQINTKGNRIYYSQSSTEPEPFICFLSASISSTT